VIIYSMIFGLCSS